MQTNVALFPWFTSDVNWWAWWWVFPVCMLLVLLACAAVLLLVRRPADAARTPLQAAILSPER